VQDHTEEGVVNVDLAVFVLNKAKLPEFVHEKIYAGTGGANGLREHLLGHFGNYLARVAASAVAGKEKQNARQAFFAGIEKLIDQVGFNPGVSRKHVGNKNVRELVLAVKNAHHFRSLDHQHGGRSDTCSSHQTNGMASKTCFAEKIAGTQDGHDGLLTRLVDYGELYTAGLYVTNGAGGVALREDAFFGLHLLNFFTEARGLEKLLDVERVDFKWRLAPRSSSV